VRAQCFATYLHLETMATSKSPDRIAFVGFSWPYFAQVRQALTERLESYPRLPVRIAPLDAFSVVHAAPYLQQLQLMAADTPPAVPPRLSIECAGLEYCLPGYQAGLGGMLEAIDRMRAGALNRAYCFSLGGHHAYPDWGHGYCLLNQAFDDTFFDQMQLPGRFYRAHEILSIFHDALAALPWQPDLICIFSGYDGHRDDCGQRITDWAEEDFGDLTRLVLDLAHRADCPVLSVHGGGYNLPVTVATAAHHVAMLATYRRGRD
jgi:acetoin utilization deacetylase AcuC-like enzyme